MAKQKKKRKAPEATNVYFGVRVDRELVEKLRQRAREHDRKVGAELNRVLRKALALEEDAEGGG
jgi:uncharacterized protein (DUF4415 family)